MAQKEVSQLDAAGYFVGIAIADESPLEPGVFLIPNGAVDATAPVVPAGHVARWAAGAWEYEPAHHSEEEHPPEESDQSSVAVTMRQARIALLRAGLLGDVNAAISALPEPQRSEALIEWEYAQDVRRDSSLVTMISSELGLSDSALDSIFNEALGI